jgi:hypothetical protein
MSCLTSLACREDRILNLQEREWYKHKVTAPGLWLGYGATTFPAITEGELLPLMMIILARLTASFDY